MSYADLLLLVLIAANAGSFVANLINLRRMQRSRKEMDRLSEQMTEQIVKLREYEAEARVLVGKGEVVRLIKIVPDDNDDRPPTLN